MAKHGWRFWFHVIHRDVGYVCVGLTLIYAISGIAVNHVQDWNPNYQVEVTRTRIEPVPEDGQSDAALATAVLGRLGVPDRYKTLFRPGAHQLRILREQHTIDVDLATGAVSQEFVTPRPVLHAANFLHLNHAKRIWTWVADAFAVALAVLAVTGMFLIKGPKGITGRGLWLTLAGIVLPLFFLWLYA